MVGVIGLGAMGGGIAATLVRSGREVVGYDIDGTRFQALADAVRGEGTGPVRAGDIDDLCARCDEIVVSLPASHIAVQALEGSVLPASRAGTVVIDMGTTLVRETKRLHDVFEARGVGFLDAPVSGGPGGASTGTLFVFVGGSRVLFEKHRPLLSTLGGSRLTWCGPSGCGQVAKGVNQLAMGLVDAAYIEAVAFGVNAGVPATVIEDAIGGDGGFRAKLRDTAHRVAEGHGDANDVKYAEHAYYLDEAECSAIPMPMLGALHEYMSRFPEDARDNMGRPYARLWSALTADR